MLSKKELYNVLKNGGEVLVFSNEQHPEYYSTIFWFHDDEGKQVNRFCRSVGIISGDGMDFDKMYEHLKNLFNEGFHIVLRGMDC